MITNFKNKTNMKLSNLKPQENIFALFVGRSGAGKSSASATFPAPILYFDFDNRMAGPLSFLQKSKLTDQIDKIEFLNYKKIMPGREYTKTGWEEVDRNLSLLLTQQNLGQNIYKTIVVSSIGNCAALFLSEALVLQGGQLIGKDSTESKYKLRVPGPGDYKYESQAVQQFLDMLLDLKGKVNVIVECHVISRFGKPGTDETGEMTPDQIKQWQKQILETVDLGDQLDLRPKLEQSTLGRFDEVYHFEKEIAQGGKQEKTYVRFRGDLARTTHNSLPYRIDITDKNFYNEYIALLQREKDNLNGKKEQGTTGIATAKSTISVR